MENNLNPPAPGPALAALIFQELVTAKLIAATDEAIFTKKLAEGQLRDSDWSVALRQMLEQNPTHDENPKT